MIWSLKSTVTYGFYFYTGSKYFSILFLLAPCGFLSLRLYKVIWGYGVYVCVCISAQMQKNPFWLTLGLTGLWLRILSPSLPPVAPRSLTYTLILELGNHQQFCSYKIISVLVEDGKASVSYKSTICLRIYSMISWSKIEESSEVASFCPNFISSVALNCQLLAVMTGFLLSHYYIPKAYNIRGAQQRFVFLV